MRKMDSEDEFVDDDVDEEEYYEETPRVWHTTTRSVRRVFTAPKLVMEKIEYSDDENSDGAPSSCDTPATDDTYDDQFSDVELEDDSDSEEISSSGSERLESRDASDTECDSEEVQECGDSD